MGGRGAGSSIPTGTAGGGADSNLPWSQTAGTVAPPTLKDALGDKGRPMSMYDAVMGGNPFYDGTYREFSENCQRAVIAYEARRRGYNVVAQPTYEGDVLPSPAYVNPNTGIRNSHWMGAFKGAKPEKVGANTSKKALENTEKKMAEYGNGSRAIMQVQWKDGGGHVLNVERKGGKTYYVDAHVGQKYTPKQLFSAVKPESIQLTRTDNLKLSDRAKKSVAPKSEFTGNTFGNKK